MTGRRSVLYNSAKLNSKLSPLFLRKGCTMEQGILDLLCLSETWEAFFKEKEELGYWRTAERDDWRAFLDAKEYLLPAQRVKEEGFCFSVPEKKLVNKSGSEKKRVVYSFLPEETRYLKVMTRLLLTKYDGCFAENCYSFRRRHGSRQAIGRLVHTKHIGRMYCCKMDVSNYFNSIKTEYLLPMLCEVFKAEPELYRFFEDMLTADAARENGIIISEQRGAMAGTPVSAFFANIYLGELDRYFAERDILYARYSDDIIFFAETQDKLATYRDVAEKTITGLGLCLNDEKTRVYLPGEAWEFLGICYRDGKVDLSETTKRKLKGKIRRKARALYRWKCRKKVSTEQTVKAMTRAFYRKLFENPRHDEMTWSRWFFPLLTTDTGLREIDTYMQEYLRYLDTGSFGKRNYRISYEMLKDWGYESLVHAYYKVEKVTNRSRGEDAL